MGDLKDYKRGNEKDCIRMKILCVLFAITWGPATAADTDDPGGWKKAKWGMTVEQVVSAFRGSKDRLVKIHDPDGLRMMDGLLAVDGCVDLQIPKIFLLGEPQRCFHVWFGFTKTTPGTLIEVDLTPNPLTSISNTFAFTALQDMLTDKYGLPAYQKRSEPKTLVYSDETVWKFPLSRIRLSLVGGSSNPQNLVLSLQYFKAKADNL
jgi:hypothetical protein